MKRSDDPTDRKLRYIKTYLFLPLPFVVLFTRQHTEACIHKRLECLCDELELMLTVRLS